MPESEQGGETVQGAGPGQGTETAHVVDPGQGTEAAHVVDPEQPGAPTARVGSMSFLERARARAGQVAEQVAEQAREAASQAREVATEQAKVAQAAVQRTSATMQDPATAEKARQAIKRAKKGVSTAIDRIDPGVLADIIIKATALQEKTNASLRNKGSVYRVAEVLIGATFPPSINFTIARIHELVEAPDGTEVDSTDLVETIASMDGTIQGLDGSTIDEADLIDDDLDRTD